MRNFEKMMFKLKSLNSLIPQLLNFPRLKMYYFAERICVQAVSALMAMQDIDGALVGGASLDAESFSKIVKFKG